MTTYEQMAIIYQRMAAASYRHAREHLEAGNLKRAALMQRGAAIDWKIAWRFLNSAMDERHDAR